MASDVFIVVILIGLFSRQRSQCSAGEAKDRYGMLSCLNFKFGFISRRGLRAWIGERLSGLVGCASLELGVSFLFQGMQDPALW